ncbi:DUF3037 domain-containing protein [Siphonobacter sp. SORGH_AS_1065]|uniref:DUF3037 domain-containing protein n=1 Tax=Siphonobacter sp. SORGH_AS_1065 TaxID=3041795 RepID=UPI0027878F0F|nr:DUF3037 domain-containing protein [Siphonobacter sp. SORGH_AS_1065]MDQ1089679.1 hypothetical protein [Siphonobacter sp. SORGH_AS_1065]
MQEKHLFEYAVIRVVPRVEREEFMNVGVILYCPKQGFLQTKFMLDESRLSALYSKINIGELYERLRAFEKVCAGKKEGGVIGQLPIASRFRWLAANRSTILQTSPLHTGFCQDANETLSRLFTQLVEK